MDTPLLLIFFNRADLVVQMMDRLRAIRPSRLYVAVDGPRAHVPSDVAACAAVRDAVMQGVDWPCELRTRFRETNLSVKYGPSDAITWLFENEEQGIILEDDVAAEPDFFPFCRELLERYRDDNRVASICGTSFWQGPATDSYYASSFADIWGWATWRDRWVAYDPDMTAWPGFADDGGMAGMPGASPRFVRYWRDIFDRTKSDDIRTWDYQWILTCFVKGTMSLFPTVPLVRNVGFGAEATNTVTTSIPRYVRTPRPLRFPLRHPAELKIDPERERAMWAFRFHISGRDDLIQTLKAPPRVARRWFRNLRAGRGRAHTP